MQASRAGLVFVEETRFIVHMVTVLCVPPWGTEKELLYSNEDTHMLTVQNGKSIALHIPPFFVFQVFYVFQKKSRFSKFFHVFQVLSRFLKKIAFFQVFKFCRVFQKNRVSEIFSRFFVVFKFFMFFRVFSRFSSFFCVF
jgi:hypothetical protein